MASKVNGAQPIDVRIVVIPRSNFSLVEKVLESYHVPYQELTVERPPLACLPCFKDVTKTFDHCPLLPHCPECPRIAEPS